MNKPHQGSSAGTYLLPTPQRLETVKEPNILKQVGEQPKTRRNSENGDAEQNQTEDRHGKKETEQSHHANTQIPHTLTQHDGPQREQDNGEDTSHDCSSHGLLLPLRTLVQPDVVHHGISLLVLFNLDGPQALGSVLWLGVVVSLVRVDLAHAQSQQREGQELEDILGGGAVGHGWEEGTLLCGGFRVGGGLDSADSSLDCRHRRVRRAIVLIVSCIMFFTYP